MRLVLAIALALTLTSAHASAQPSGTAPVSCGSIVTSVGEVTWRANRVVLGVVAVPSSLLTQTVRAGDGRWPYWSKAGLVIRANSPPVVVRVAPGIWDRAAIDWGGRGPAGALRFESCPPAGSLGEWNAYAGGFRLRAKSACVPLVFSVGDRTQTVRFGVGRRCR